MDVASTKGSEDDSDGNKKQIVQRKSKFLMKTYCICSFQEKNLNPPKFDVYLEIRVRFEICVKLNLTTQISTSVTNGFLINCNLHRLSLIVQYKKKSSLLYDHVEYTKFQ